MRVFTLFSGVENGVFECLFSGGNSDLEIFQENLGEIDDSGNQGDFRSYFML
jgi:hypothetical protein